MKRTAVSLAVFAFALAEVIAADPAAKDDASEPADVATISLQNLDGESVAPLKCEVKQKAAVVIFTTTDCPIANAYVPEINRLHLAYASRGVRLTLVHADAATTVEKAKEHATDYELNPEIGIVIDREFDLVKACGADVTPEAFVYDAEGKLRYRGRINNLFADLGQRRATVTVHDLRDALEAVINDREVVVAETDALGCYIEVP